MGFSDRYEYLRNYLDAVIGEKNSHFLLGFIVFLGFPSLSIIQNFFITILVNIPKTKRQFDLGVRKLIEASKTNFTNFSSIDDFSTQKNQPSMPKIIFAYFLYTFIPFIFLVILLEFNLEVPICYDFKEKILNSLLHN